MQGCPAFGLRHLASSCDGVVLAQPWGRPHWLSSGYWFVQQPAAARLDAATEVQAQLCLHGTCHKDVMTTTAWVVKGSMLRFMWAMHSLSSVFDEPTCECSQLMRREQHRQHAVDSSCGLNT